MFFALSGLHTLNTSDFEHELSVAISENVRNPKPVGLHLVTHCILSNRCMFFRNSRYSSLTFSIIFLFFKSLVQVFMVKYSIQKIAIYLYSVTSFMYRCIWYKQACVYMYFRECMYCKLYHL